MFSWTSNRRGGPGGTAASATDSSASSSFGSAYPATARVTTSTPTTATPILGSIRPPDTTSNSTSTGFSRQRHLESFLNDDTLKRSTRRVSADDTTYDTVFSTVAGDTLILRIHLAPCPQHPYAGSGAATQVRAPAMTLAGVTARHAWLDRQMRVIGYPAITSDVAWKDSRLLLGTAVKEVIQHLQIEPPEIVQILDEALKVIQKPKPKPAAATASAASSSLQDRQPQQQPHRRYSPVPSSTDAPPDYETVLNDVPSMEMPSIPMYFDELDERDLPQLNQLLNDQVLFHDFCNKLSVTKLIQKISTSVIVDNAAMARENLSQRHDLQLLYGEVAELRQKVQQQVTAFRELEKQQDALCAPPDPMVVMKQLVKAKKEAFDESEQIAEDWLEQMTTTSTTTTTTDGTTSTNQSSQNVDAFVKSFMEKRKVHHLRAAKMEILRRQGSKSI